MSPFLVDTLTGTRPDNHTITGLPEPSASPITRPGLVEIIPRALLSYACIDFDT